MEQARNYNDDTPMMRLNTLLDDSHHSLSRVSEGKSHGGGDDDSSFHSGSGSGSRTNLSTSKTTKSSYSDPEEAHTRRERKIMDHARIFVMAFLLSLAAIAAYVWWRYDRNRQESLYQQNFEELATKLVDIFMNRMAYKVSVASAVATSIATSCNNDDEDSTASWPNCGLERFERRMAGPRRLAGATSVWFAPLLQGHTQRVEWETFAKENFQYYFEEANIFADPIVPPTIPYRITEWPVKDGIFQIQNSVPTSQAYEEGNEDTLFAPIWQSSPSSITTTSLPMFNQYTEETRKVSLDSLLRMHNPEGEATSSSSVFSASIYQGKDDSIVNQYHNDALHVSLYTPILSGDANNNKQSLAGALTMDLSWFQVFESATNGAPAPLTIVLENTLGQTFTLESSSGYGGANNTITLIDGEDAIFFQNELNMSMSSLYQDFANLVLGVEYDGGDDHACLYRVHIYPTPAFEDAFLTKSPILTGLGVGGIVLFVAAVFVIYDMVIEKRQARVVASAKRSNAIVKSLFPAGVRNRLMDGDGKGGEPVKKLEHLLPKDFLPMQTQKARIQSFLTIDPATNTAGNNNNGNLASHVPRYHPEAPSNILGSEPIADFFPATTILFADLAGFTAWSSSREPSQVFMLLETLYGAMDKTARRLGVFKVETVGDCYVAATGIPDPRDDHAVLMVRFARSSLDKIEELTDSLESALGPGTGDLAMRMGIHSGPVTAGVLRGEKSRFQLFGDTMNTAARMESTGERRRVHISKDTADLLFAAGKGPWLEERGESVVAKGKGQLTTYWLKQESVRRRFSTSERSRYRVSGDQDGTETSQSSGMEDDAELSFLASTLSPDGTPTSDTMKAIKADLQERKRGRRAGTGSLEADPYGLQRMDRLVDYNVDVLIALLKKIVARRSVVDAVDVKDADNSTHGHIALDEIKELIEMPVYNAEAAVKMASESTIEIPDDVRNELRNYIHRIANSYNLNPFHNFEHASHVALSVNKLMKRIVMPDDVDYRRNTKQGKVEKVIAVSKDLHEATLGISSDPVTQFACVFVALIHDAGHTGVPNFVVAKEEPALAEKYRNKSLAEQRSIDIAWGILMEDSYENLRRCMFPSVAELKHFRQLIVNSVMATDIFDKELSGLRKARWQKCFHPEEMMLPADESKADVFNRKATIVIEHIIQASDVAHTMQHWHVYQKWNERLFKEMYAAYKDGRQDSDPSTGWYKGELWFFDHYVIPLARKLDECGVFGVSSAEYLNYAVENRNEWERKGEVVVARLVASVKEDEVSD